MEPMADASSVERMLLMKAKKSGIPINGSIELTPLCNMNCDMCYVRMNKDEMEHAGRLRSADEWLKIGQQMKKAGVLFLLLTGGEPLLYPEFKEVYLGLKNMGMILTINTNGTLINEEWADFFQKHKPRRINITLYGESAETYESLCHYGKGFDQVMTAVNLLTERNIDVKIGGSVAKANEPYIDQIIDCGEKLGVPVRIDTYMMPAERERNKPFDMQSRLDPEAAAKVRINALKKEMGEETFRQYVIQSLIAVETFVPADTPRCVTCYAGNCSFTINWQGSMRPCVVLSTPSVSVFEHGFDEAWNKVREEVGKIRLNLKCSQCNLRTFCRTCAASALLETGSFDGVPEYMCRYAAESYRLIKLEAEKMNNEK